ncbi:helix-turn-helix transcriptional regulator [Mesorhizobium sp. M0848]|uniref:helix-turn-helix domain-containing protein n=1 Tax=Mesorhizobium sp. M0848 TaxID=2957012 RepID=UPI003339D2F9
MTDMTDLDQIVPASAKKARRSLARRADRAGNTETLRISLDRVVNELGFSTEDGITAPSLELGLTLKQARLAKALTQDELAKRIGLSQNALSMIENGRGSDGPTWTTVSRICEALGIEPSFLPTDARQPVANDVEVRMFKASKGPKAKVREADLGEAAAAVALSLLSKEVTTWLRAALSNAGLGLDKLPTRLVGSRFLSLAPHSGTRIKATDDPLVVIAVVGAGVEIRAVALREGSGKTLINDSVALVSRTGTVEVGNTSNESSVVFALPATQLLKDGEVLAS